MFICQACIWLRVTTSLGNFLEINYRMETINIIFLHCQICTVNTIIVIIIISFILDIDILGISNNTMSKQFACKTDTWMQVLNMSWFLGTRENWVACVDGQREYYNLLFGNRLSSITSLLYGSMEEQGIQSHHCSKEDLATCHWSTPKCLFLWAPRGKVNTVIFLTSHC